jgi:signal transduction histidine kinase
MMNDTRPGPYGGGMDALRNPIRWLRQHPLAADSLLFVLITSIMIGFGIAADVEPGQRTIGALGWFLIVAAHAPVIWRRIQPVGALWVSVAFTVPFWILDYPDAPIGSNLLILLYSLAAHAGRPSSIRHFWGTFAVLMSVLTAGVLSHNDDVPWLALPANIVVIATMWILGDNLRTRRDYLHELEQNAAMAEERQVAEAQRAVQQERTRIARELHDVVAHSMSVMVVQAAAARRIVTRSPADATAALEAIETTGRESLHEMRRVLGVLRGDEDEAELAPAPGLDDFGRLLQQCEEAGLPVDLEVTGDPRRLAPGLELSAYRVVQESLTNSLKHAGPARATVRLHYRPEMLELEVTDDGRGASSTAGAGGQGLIGMRERVDAFGGTLAAGPRPGGGFRVSASFPAGESR